MNELTQIGRGALNAVRTGPRGSAPALLLHSAGLDLTYWDQQIEALRRDHDVVAVDLPGHGRSPGTAEDMRVETIACRVAQVIRDLDVPRVHVVGLSVGGVIAQWIAAEHPSRIASLTLIDTGACFASRTADAMRVRAGLLREHRIDAVLDQLFDHWFLPETLTGRPDLVDRVIKTLSSIDVEVFATLWEAIADVDIRHRLGHIVAPTAVLVGEHDSSSPVATATELAAAIPGAELTVVPDAAHLSPIEAPVEISRMIATMLAGTP